MPTEAPATHGHVDEEEDPDGLRQRGGRIDPLASDGGRAAPFDDDDRVDEAIAESFPASDPPSWNGGLDRRDPG